MEHFEHKEGNKAIYNIIAMILSEVVKCNIANSLNSQNMLSLIFFLGTEAPRRSRVFGSKSVPSSMNPRAT